LYRRIVRARRIADRGFVAGALSIADLAIFGWGAASRRPQGIFRGFPHVGHWYSATMARRAVKRGMEAKLG
jgi:GST-like protein